VNVELFRVAFELDLITSEELDVEISFSVEEQEILIAVVGNCWVLSCWCRNQRSISRQIFYSQKHSAE